MAFLSSCVLDEIGFFCCSDGSDVSDDDDVGSGLVVVSNALRFFQNKLIS